MDDAAVSDELQRIRQAMSLSRDIRRLGPHDFSLRPILHEHVHRYSRGRCMDFAVRLAARSGMRLAALQVPGGWLSHAFLVPPGDVRGGHAVPGAACLDVSGIWSQREMRALQRANDGGGLQFILPDLGATLASMAASEGSGASFDAEEVVLAVAGCLPHLHDLVPAALRATGAEAMERLDAIRASGWADAAAHAARPTAPR